MFEEQHYLLQKELKDEETNKLDEKTIFEEDRKIGENIKTFLKRMQKMYKAEQERKKLKFQIKCSFMERISEKPFQIRIGNDWLRFCYS